MLWGYGTVKLTRQFQPAAHFVLRNATKSVAHRNGLLSPNQASCLASLPRETYKALSLFKSLEPKRSSYEMPQLLQNLSWRTNVSKTNDFIKTLPRSFFGFGKNKDDKPQKKRVPKLILIQNPLKWLMIKLDFTVLRSMWDSEFKEKDFKVGSKQAISRVTQVISDGQYGDLNGLLTKAAKVSLMRDLDRNWSERQRSLLHLTSDDIQISSPRKVYFIRIADKKYCDIDTAFLALKWVPINVVDALIFTEIFARFHREYTPHSIPEWTIAYFKITRFQIVRSRPNTSAG